MPESPEERRRFRRIATDKTATLRLGERMISGVVHDISLRGLLLQTSEDLPSYLAIGAPVSARVDLGGASWQIEFEGTVAHLANRQAGIQCQRMGLDSAARLRRLVELNLAAPQLLERELAELIQG